MPTPNLLYIFTDQQRADTLRCYGNDQIQTPALNGLAEESFVFENTYVSQPVCSPSRATMLTGLWPHTAGVPACNVPLSADVPTIAEYLSDEYDCAYMGKWHLGDEIFPQHGFDTWVGSEDTYRHSFSDPTRLPQLSSYHQFLVENGFEPDVENRGAQVFSRHMAAGLEEPFTKATFLGDQAAQFIRERGDQPFALCVSYLEPHPPHTGPLNDLYDPWSLPTGPEFMKPPPDNAPLFMRLMASYYMASEEYGYDLRTEAGWRAVRARYWGNVTLVDRSVGKILRALDESGQADNTLVVFTSDHGEMAGDHGILGKTVMYEASVRVPMLIRAPMLGREQTVFSGNFSHIDLAPTILDLLDQSVPERMQGRSRVPVMNGTEDLTDNDVFIEWNGRDGHIPASIGEAEVNRSMGEPYRTIVTADRWKLNLYTRGQSELYDLNTDSYEMNNLIDIPDHNDLIQDLTDRIHRWREETGDRSLQQ